MNKDRLLHDTGLKGMARNDYRTEVYSTSKGIKLVETNKWGRITIEYYDSYPKLPLNWNETGNWGRHGYRNVHHAFDFWEIKLNLYQPYRTIERERESNNEQW